MKILCLCLGNICRSPLAQGILESRVQSAGLHWQIDSAGTSAYHIGERPDHRSISTAAEHGIDITRQRARQLAAADLEEFDLILAMDTSNYRDAMSLATTKSQEDKIKLILNYVYPRQNRSVPDPYYNDGFDAVYDLLDQAADQLISEYI